MPNYIQLAINTVKNWWIPLIVGALFLAVGIISFAHPKDSYGNLTKFISIAFLIGGVLEIIFAISNRKEMRGWGWLLVTGIVASISGWMMLGSETLAETSVAFIVAFFLVYRSLIGISQGLELRAYGDSDWNVVFWVSILSTVLSLILLFNPDLAALGLVFWTATAFVLVGVLLMMLAYGLRRIKRIPNRIEKSIKKGYRDFRNNVEDRIDDLEDRAEDFAEGVEDRIEDIQDSVEDRIDDLKDSAQSALNKLRGKDKK